MGKFFDELKRRNVMRVAIAYIVVGWLAFQLGEIVLPTFGAPDWVFKTLIFMIVLGFPFVMLFAWAFELTPEGVKKTRDVEVATSITGTTGRKLDFVIIAALALALGYFIWESRFTDDQPTAVADQESEVVADEPVEITETSPGNRSIAVLPFDDMSPDGDQEWFADGLAEEILNALARTPDLLVSARNSSFAYKNSDKSVPAIATELGVEHILEGSVRRSGDRLRVTAQLIRADDGFHLWSQNYDRTPDDMIEIQENVAIEIAKALQTAMDPEALAEMVSAGTSSIPAYEAYLHGLAYGIDTESTGDIYEYLGVLDSFNKAVEIDPAFAAAHGQLAWFWEDVMTTSNIAYGVIELPKETMRENFDVAIDAAIRHATTDSQRNKYRAFRARVHGRHGQALRLVEEYLEQQPNDFDAVTYKLQLMKLLRSPEELQQTIEEAVVQYAHSTLVSSESILASLNTDDAEFMRDVAESGMRNHPDSVFVAYQAHRAYLWAGDIDSASLLLPRLTSSDLGASTRMLAELRQACAENRLEDGRKLMDQILAYDEEDGWAHWWVLRMSSKDQEAIEMLRPFDDARDFATMDDYASYPYFDRSNFPKFDSHMLAEGAVQHDPVTLPYACKFDS